MGAASAGGVGFGGGAGPGAGIVSGREIGGVGAVGVGRGTARGGGGDGRDGAVAGAGGAGVGGVDGALSAALLLGASCAMSVRAGSALSDKSKADGCTSGGDVHSAAT